MSSCSGPAAGCAPAVGGMFPDPGDPPEGLAPDGAAALAAAAAAAEAALPSSSGASAARTRVDDLQAVRGGTLLHETEVKTELKSAFDGASQISSMQSSYRKAFDIPTDCCGRA